MGCINTIPKDTTMPKQEDSETNVTQATNPSPSLRASINSGDTIAVTPSLNSINSIFSPRYESTVQEMNVRFREAFQLNPCTNNNQLTSFKTSFNRINSRSVSTLEPSMIEPSLISNDNKQISEIIEENTIEESLDDQLYIYNNNKLNLNTRRITTLECKIEETLEQQNQLLASIEVQHKMGLDHESIEFVNPHDCYEDYHDQNGQQSE